REQGIAHEVCGKLVVATSEEEVGRLRELLTRGTANGLADLRWLGPDEMREIEPHVAGVAAVRVPEEGIVDYPNVCGAMVRQIEGLGGKIVTGAKVTRLRASGSGWEISTAK